MGINWKKVAIASGITVATGYVLFLASPIVVSPILNAHAETFASQIKTATGFDTNIEGISFLAYPNLSAGIRLNKFSLSVPSAQSPFLQTEKASARIALLPILLRQIQLTKISADTISANLDVKKDGTFLIMDYLPQNDNDTETKTTSLPLGLKLSNHLPNVNVKNYNVGLVELLADKKYSVDGENLKITDFILDKKIKLSTKGKVVLDNHTASNFDIKIQNKIMPDVQLNDLIFPQETEQEVSETEANNFDIFTPLKKIAQNQLSADLTADIKTSGTLKNPKVLGKIDVEALTVGVDGKLLPESYLKLLFKGNRTDIDSILFTSSDESEKTQLIGSVRSGKNRSIDLTLRSNAKFNNVINLVDSVAKTFGINDFDTLSAAGGIDADFNINSDMKKVSSTGYLKILPASIRYGLYNVLIDKITADIDMTNNNINIKKAGFSILGHPLSLKGTIKSDATTDITLNADKLSIKGLLTACGQLSLLKSNDINSGEISLNAVLKGKLSELKPEITSTIQKLNVYNKQAGAKLTLSNALIKLLYDGKSASGDVDVTSLVLTHPVAVVSVPKTNIVIDSKNINIKNSYLLVDNSRIDITGSIKDYISEKMNINLDAKGSIASSAIVGFLPKDFASLISHKGSLPVEISVSGNQKVQNIKTEITANSNNYVALADLDALKNKNTKIHSNIEIIGDSLTLSNTGLSNDSEQIATVTGGISKLYTSPKMNLNIAVPNVVSFPIWGVSNSNISANGSITVVGSFDKPQMRGTVNITDLSMKDMDFAITDLVADLSGDILNGEADAKQFKYGGIVATDINGSFSLKNYANFYLTDLSAKAFDGKLKGDLSYAINGSKVSINISGNGLNSTKAVAGAVGINNALTGTMDFNAKINTQGLTDKEIINNLNGNVDFNVADGRFINIGKLENLVNAQNVSSNSVLKSAISALSSASTVQEADKFKNIKGDLTLANGVANLSKILVAGPLMAYYVKGTYNFLPNTANLVILGRLDSSVVSVLGVLGELSVDKLLSYIPKFGTATSNMLKQLTADPSTENTTLIPELSGGSTTYKDFKVIFNGAVESSSSVKSFKWLSSCDTSKMNVKEELQNAKEAVKTNVTEKVETAKTTVQNVKTNVSNTVEAQKTKVQEAKNTIEQTKTDIQNAKANVKQSSENVKNLLQNALKNTQTKPSTTTTTEEATSSEVSE
jgi:uncharacterized protein involved in outer membrane biogenesis